MKLIYESRQLAYSPESIVILKKNGWRAYKGNYGARPSHLLASRLKRAKEKHPICWIKKVTCLNIGIIEIERILNVDTVEATDSCGAPVHWFYWKDKRVIGGFRCIGGWNVARILYPDAGATPRETAALLERAAELARQC